MNFLTNFFFTVFITIISYSLVGQITIHPNNRIASLQMSTTDYNSWVDNDEFRTDSAKKRALVEDIYESFSDDFDFIFFILNEIDRPNNLGYLGVYSSVSNATQGIGSSIFDNSASYGSAGQLKGLIQIPARRYIMNGPTLHELMHNWANRAIDGERFDNDGNAISSGSHWGYVGGSSKGQLGGFDLATLVENGNNSYTVDSFGTFANGGNAVPYNELELYLMGMIPSSQLSNFEVFTGISNYSFDAGKITFSATTRTVYTPAILENQEGVRIPNATNSQKDFKALTIVLTPTPLTNTEWDEIDQQIERLGRTSDEGTSLYNFWEATGGLGTLNVENIQNSLGITSNQLTDIINLKIYPIPTQHQLTIALDNTYNLQTATIYNLLGQNVLSKNWSHNQIENTLDTQNLNNGIYLLELKIDEYNTPIRKKIILKK